MPYSTGRLGRERAAREDPSTCSLPDRERVFPDGYCFAPKLKDSPRLAEHRVDTH